MLKFLKSLDSDLDLDWYAGWGHQGFAWPIRDAVTGNHLDVIKYLAEDNTDTKFKVVFGLAEAIRRNHVDIIDFLYRLGSHNMSDNNYKYIGTVACTYGRLNIIKYFIERGHQQYLLSNQMIVGYAAYSNNYELIRFLVEECGCDPRAKSDVAIRLAGQYCSVKILKYLLSFGCDLAPVHRMSALSGARLHNNIPAIEFLSDMI